MHFGEVNRIAEVDDHHSGDKANKCLGHEDRLGDVSQKSNEAGGKESVQGQQEEEDEILSSIDVETAHEVDDGAVQDALQKQNWNVQYHLRNVVQTRVVHCVGFLLLNNSASNE